MKDYIKVFGGIFGSAIILPATIMATMVSSLGAAFGKGGGIKLEVILSILTLIGTFSVPAFTAMNFIKPDNSLRGISSLIILIVGIISVITIGYLLIKSFSLILLIVFLAAVALTASGWLQYQDNSDALKN